MSNNPEKAPGNRRKSATMIPVTHSSRPATTVEPATPQASGASKTGRETAVDLEKYVEYITADEKAGPLPVKPTASSNFAASGQKNVSTVRQDKQVGRKHSKEYLKDVVYDPAAEWIKMMERGSVVEGQRGRYREL